MRILKQPIKVIDNFLESPFLWRDFALDQEYNKSEIPAELGVQSKELNLLNINLFNSIARKLIIHIHDRTMFKFLKINFISTDEQYNRGWIKKEDSFFNVVGLIFLNFDNNKTGIEFFHQIKDLEHNYHSLFLEEYNSNSQDFLKLKDDQQNYFRRSIFVKSMFNRCVMFHPDTWYRDGEYFGKTLEDSRIIIKFCGITE